LTLAELLLLKDVPSILVLQTIVEVVTENSSIKPEMKFAKLLLNPNAHQELKP